jgi:lipopolysaccharide transport system permease protein
MGGPCASANAKPLIARRGTARAGRALYRPMKLHILELIFFSTYAELRAERARSYLGLIWWLLEPAMQMGTYYLVFAVVMRTATPDFVPFLLIGLVTWQWFKSAVTHGGLAIWYNLPLIRQVKLPAAIFPSVQILADTTKFIFILLLLLIVLWCTGYPPNSAYFALIPVLIIEFLFASAIAYLVASLVPLLPDLRFVIDQILVVAMFMSGVVFSTTNVPAPWHEILALNPMVGLIDSLRGILMHGQWPDWMALLRLCAVSIALYLLALLLIQRLTPRYVKQAA